MFKSVTVVVVLLCISAASFAGDENSTPTSNDGEQLKSAASDPTAECIVLLSDAGSEHDDRTGLIDSAFLTRAIDGISTRYANYEQIHERGHSLKTLASMVQDILRRITGETDAKTRKDLTKLLFPQIFSKIYVEYPGLIIGQSAPDQTALSAYRFILEKVEDHASRNDSYLNWIHLLDQWSKTISAEQQERQKARMLQDLQKPGVYLVFCLERAALYSEQWNARYSGVRFEEHSFDTLVTMANELVDEISRSPSFFADFEALFPELHEGFREMRRLTKGGVVEVHSQELIQYAKYILRNPTGFKQHQEGVQEAQRTAARVQERNQVVDRGAAHFNGVSWGAHNYGSSGYMRDLDRFIRENNLSDYEIAQLHRRLGGR